MIVALYVVGLVALTYLIYRYGRYNPWSETPIGRAFMASKTALWAIIAFALSTAIFGDWAGKDAARAVLVGYALLSIFYQLTVVVQFQGGFRRRRNRGDGGKNYKD